MVWTDLHEAAKQGQVEDVRTLSSLHPTWLTERDGNAGFMPLHVAAWYGQAECARALLGAGAPVDARVGMGSDTPLIIASRFGRVGCVHALLAAGADVLAANLASNTALHYAAQFDDVSTLHALLDRLRPSGMLGAAVQARDHRGSTPLHGAAFTGSTACIAALLASGSDISALTAANPNSEWGGKATALHLAALSSRPEAVQLIAGLAPALATARTSDGSTPLDVARQEGYFEAVRCLEQPVPTAAALSALADAGLRALPLFAQLLASRWPLSREEWELVPTPCPGLGTLLPQAVREPDKQAALLVRHLPHADRERLRASILSLAWGRDGLGSSLPRLPPDVVRCILGALFA